MTGTRRTVTGLLLLALATPLVWAQGFLLPYVIPKAFFFQSVVGLALLVATLSWIAGDEDPPDTRERPAIWRRDPIFMALAALVAVGGVSAVFGDAPGRSLLGGLERRWGVLAWALFLALYGLLRFHLDDRGWRRALRVTVVVGTVVALVGVLGHHGVFTHEGGVEAPWHRVSSTLGNAGYLAACLALTATISAYLAWSSSVPYRRALWGLAAALQVYGVLLTGTRAVVVGAAAGLAVVTGVALLFSADRWVRITSAGVLLMVGVASLVVWTAPTDPVLSGALDRLGAISTDATSVRKRFSVWGAALAGIESSPLLGAGPENFHLVWSRHFDPVMYNLSPQLPGFDRAHNVLAEAGATMGAPGLLAYLGLLAAAAYALVRSWRRGGLAGAEAAIFGFGLAAYFVYLFLWFEDYGSFVVFVVLVGFLGHRAFSRSEARPGAEGDGHGGPEGIPSRGVRALVGLPLLLLVGVVGWHNVRVLNAARGTWKGEITMDAWEGTESFQAALARDLPGSASIVRVYLRRLAFLSRFGDQGSPAGTTPRMSDALAAGSRAIDAWEQRDPLNPDVYLQRARLCDIRRDVRGEALDDPCVLPSLRRAIELAPRRIRIRHGLARHHLSRGRPDRALAVLDRALEVYDSFGETYHYMARARWELDEPEEALRQAGIAISLGYGRQPGTFILDLVDWLAAEGRYGEAAHLVESHLELRYRKLARPELETPAGRGLQPWDLPLASRLPLLHWRAGRPGDAIGSARFLAHRLPDSGGGEAGGRDARIRRFVADVGADRRERWRRSRGILAESPDAGASGEGADASAPPRSGPRPDDTGVTPGPEPADHGSDTKRPGGAEDGGPAGHGQHGVHAPGAADRVDRPRADRGGRASRTATVPGDDRAATRRVGLSRPTVAGADAGHRSTRRGSHPDVVAGRADTRRSRRPNRQQDAASGRHLPGRLGPAAAIDPPLQQPRSGGSGKPVSLSRATGGSDREQLLGTAEDRAVQHPVSPPGRCTFFNDCAPVAVYDMLRKS